MKRILALCAFALVIHAPIATAAQRICTQKKGVTVCRAPNAKELLQLKKQKSAALRRAEQKRLAKKRAQQRARVAALAKRKAKSSIAFQVSRIASLNAVGADQTLSSARPNGDAPIYLTIPANGNNGSISVEVTGNPHAIQFAFHSRATGGTFYRITDGARGSKAFLCGSASGNAHACPLIPAGRYTVRVAAKKSASERYFSDIYKNANIQVIHQSAGPVIPPVVDSNVQARIDTLNQVNADGAITGTVPLTVFVGGVQAPSASSTYHSCDSMIVPSYVVPGGPNRAVYERSADDKSACFKNISQQVLAASQRALGRGNLMTAKYSWNFGDSSGTSLYNQLEGWNASHTYNQVGTYTITHTVTNEVGESKTVSRTVQVLPSSRTMAIYLSATGNDANPGTQNLPIRTIGKLSTMVAGKGNYTVNFKAGETFETGRGSFLTVDGSNVLITKYGSGSAPRIVWVGAPELHSKLILVQPSARNVIIEDLEFDTAMPSPVAGAKFEKDGLPSAIIVAGDLLTIRRNKFLNLVDAIHVQGKRSCAGGCRTDFISGIHIEKNTAPNVYGLRAFFVWGGTFEHMTIVGNSAANSTREHIVRLADNFQLVNGFDNDFRNTVVDDKDQAKGGFTIQGGSLAYLKANRIYEASITFAPLGGKDGIRGENNFFGKADSNRMSAVSTNQAPLRGGNVGIEIGTGAEHISITNTFFDMGSGISHTRYSTSMSVQPCSEDLNRCPDDILIAHNTFSAAAESTNRAFLKVEHGGRGVRVLNNLFVRARYASGSGPQTPMTIGTLPGSDVPSTTVSAIGCNVYPLPTYYRSTSTPFDINQHGVNVIGNSFVTHAAWNAALRSRNGVHGADKLLQIPFERQDIDAIPELGYETVLRCPAVPGVFSDGFGLPRGNLTTAGAYQY